MKLKPVNDKIVVKPKTQEEEVTESGILLPDTVDTGKLIEGEVDIFRYESREKWMKQIMEIIEETNK